MDAATPSPDGGADRRGSGPCALDRGEDVLATFARHRGAIGHVQFAGVPDRGPPDGGLVDWKAILGAMRRLGWAGRFGAEYRPGGTTEESLAWLADFQSLA